MKSKFLIVTALFAIVFSSCKNETETKKTEAAEEVKANFTAEFDLTSDKDDALAFYYTEDGSISFTPEKVYWLPIIAGKDYKKVTVTAPDDHLPKSIRVDFGAKKGAEQGTITLKSFKISCYNKTIEGNGTNFLNYFIKDGLVEVKVDSTAGTITFLPDLKNNSNHFYYPTQLLLDELKKIEN
jgi:hypothetical protein